MDSPTGTGNAHTRIGGSMAMLTPTDRFATDQVFRTPYIQDQAIADLIIIANMYPVQSLYMNDKILDVSAKCNCALYS